MNSDFPPILPIPPSTINYQPSTAPALGQPAFTTEYAEDTEAFYVLSPNQEPSPVSRIPYPVSRFTYSPIHPFTDSPIHPFTDSPIHPFTHSPKKFQPAPADRFFPLTQKSLLCVSAPWRAIHGAFACPVCPAPAHLSSQPPSPEGEGLKDIDSG